MSSLRLPSYAKVNLSLIVKGRRGDGFHEIETLIQQVDLNDEIELTTRDAPGIKFRCNREDLPTGKENLCVRAADLFMDATGIQKGLEIKLEKVIPTGAGLGGGSSNAAVTLLGLNVLWQMNFQPIKLFELASRLGSDVPFFIRGGTALARGRGEVLSYCDFDFDNPILMVFPGINISTAWAYKRLNLSLTMRKKSIKLASFNDRNFNDVDFYKEFENEFEETVFERYQVLREIKNEILKRKPLFAGMSGSGSTIFGVFRQMREAIETKRFFDREYRTFITRPIRWGYQQACHQAS